MINREDTNIVKPPMVSTPCNFQGHLFLMEKKNNKKWIPITKLTQPLVLSQKTLGANDWVEEEGLNKSVNFQLLIMKYKI